MLEADDDDLLLVCLEDMAIASVAAPLLSEELHLKPELWDATVERWQGLRGAVKSGFRPLRLQPLFMRALDTLRLNRVETLGRWEVAVLLKAIDLATPLGQGPAALFRDAVLPYAGDLRTLAQHHGPVYDLELVQLDLCYVTGEDIAKCRPREVKSVSGIDIGFVGPLLSHTGSLKVLGSVADTSAVVVENGTCYVNGFVFGRVIASDACHVGRNIAGKVIVRHGNISAESVFRRAFVVTKNGTVEVRTTEDPDLVFGGAGIAVAERTIMGTCVAPRIDIGQEAIGGVYAVSDHLRAPWFRCTDDRPLSIFLQRTLMPEDYGEILNHDARRLTIQWVKLRQQLLSLERSIATIEDEIERTAASAISYMLGGEVVRTQVEEIRKAERRLQFLERLIVGLDALNESAEAQPDSVDEVDSDPESDSEWDEFTTPWTDDSEPDDVESAWVQDERELSQLGETLGRTRADVRTREALFRWSEKRLEWVRERNEVLGAIERRRAELKRLMGRVESVNSLDLQLSKQRQLAVLLESRRDRNAKADWADRVAKPFMRLLLRNIASQRNRANHYGQNVPVLRDRLKQMSEQLLRDYSVRLDVDDTRRQPAVSGRFDQGIRIYARRFRERPDPTDLYMTTSGDDAPHTFVRDGNGIAERPPSTAPRS